MNILSIIVLAGWVLFMVMVILCEYFKCKWCGYVHLDDEEEKECELRHNGLP